MNIIDKGKKRYEAVSKPVKASVWFVICFIIQRGMQFLSMPIYTRIMTQEDYGIYSVFLSWFNVICVFTSLNLYSGTFNKAMIRYEDKRDQYISSVQMLTTITTAVFGVMLLVFRKTVSSITGFSTTILLLMIIHLLSFPTIQYWSQELRFYYAYKPFVGVTVLNSLLSMALGILAVFFFPDKSLALIGSVVGVQALISAVLYIYLLRKGRCICHKESWKWSLGLAVPLLPHYLSEILLGHSDRLMINQMCGSAQAGIYNIVYQISMIMTIVRTGVNGAFVPWLYYSIKNKQYGNIRNATGLLTAMMSVMSVFFMIIGPEILRIAAPSSYYEAVVDIPAIMAGGFFIFVYVMFVYVETYYEEKQYVSIASISCTILNIVLNYRFIAEYGYLVAGYTTMVSYMAMSVMHYLFLKKITRKHSEISKMFNYRFLFGVSICIVIASFMNLVMYHHTALRYILVLVFFGALFIKRYVFLDLLKKAIKKDKSV